MSLSDEEFMKMALEEAEKAASMGEVPIGAVIVHEGQVIARGFNRKETSPSALHHAEILAISEATQKLGRWRLTGCTMYVTLEPCLMCAGALVQARLDRVVFGALDAKAGAVQSLYQALSDVRLNHRPEILGEVYAEPCSKILKRFFEKIRMDRANADS